MRARRFTFRLLGTGLLLAATVVQAQDDPRAVRLNWNAAAGAGSYQLQVRDAEEKVVLDERVRGTSHVFRLPPGAYSQRIAAIDRFNLPGNWSPWQPLKIRPTRTPQIAAVVPVGKPAADGSQKIEVRGRHFTPDSKVYLRIPGSPPVEVPIEKADDNTIAVRVTPAQVADGNYSLTIENPRGLQKSREESVAVVDRKIVVPEAAQKVDPAVALNTADSGEPDEDGEQRETIELGAFGPWATLVPGLPAIARGDNSGYGWAAGTTALVALSAAEYQAAATRRKNFERNPLYQFFNNPAIFTSQVLGSNPSTTALASAGYVYVQQEAAARSSFQNHLRAHYALGGAALAVYATHFWWENRAHWRMTHLVPGASHFRRGQWIRGSLWVAGLSAAAGGAVYESQRADAINRSLNNNPYARIIGQPVSAIALGTNLGLPSATTLSAYYGASSYSVARQNQARKHTQNAAALTAAFGALYFGQLVDATITEAGAAAAAQETPTSLIQSRQRPLLEEEVQEVSYYISLE